MGNFYIWCFAEADRNVFYKVGFKKRRSTTCKSFGFLYQRKNLSSREEAENAYDYIQNNHSYPSGWDANEYGSFSSIETDAFKNKNGTYLGHSYISVGTLAYNTEYFVIPYFIDGSNKLNTLTSERKYYSITTVVPTANLLQTEYDNSGYRNQRYKIEINNLTMDFYNDTISKISIVPEGFDVEEFNKEYASTTFPTSTNNLIVNVEAKEFSFTNDVNLDLTQDFPICGVVFFDDVAEYMSIYGQDTSYIYLKRKFRIYQFGNNIVKTISNSTMTIEFIYEPDATQYTYSLILDGVRQNPSTILRSELEETDSVYLGARKITIPIYGIQAGTNISVEILGHKQIQKGTMTSNSLIGTATVPRGDTPTISTLLFDYLVSSDKVVGTFKTNSFWQEYYIVIYNDTDNTQRQYSLDVEISGDTASFEITGGERGKTYYFSIYAKTGNTESNTLLSSMFVWGGEDGTLKDLDWFFDNYDGCSITISTYAHKNLLTVGIPTDNIKGYGLYVKRYKVTHSNSLSFKDEQIVSLEEYENDDGGDFNAMFSDEFSNGDIGFYEMYLCQTDSSGRITDKSKNPKYWYKVYGDTSLDSFSTNRKAYEDDDFQITDPSLTITYTFTSPINYLRIRIYDLDDKKTVYNERYYFNHKIYNSYLTEHLDIPFDFLDMIKGNRYRVSLTEAGLVGAYEGNGVYDLQGEQGRASTFGDSTYRFEFVCMYDKEDIDYWKWTTKCDTNGDKVIGATVIDCVSAKEWNDFNALLKKAVKLYQDKDYTFTNVETWNKYDTNHTYQTLTAELYNQPIQCLENVGSTYPSLPNRVNVGDVVELNHFNKLKSELNAIIQYVKKE